MDTVGIASNGNIEGSEPPEWKCFPHLFIGFSGLVFTVIGTFLVLSYRNMAEADIGYSVASFHNSRTVALLDCANAGGGKSIECQRYRDLLKLNLSDEQMAYSRKHHIGTTG